MTHTQTFAILALILMVLFLSQEGAASDRARCDAQISELRARILVLEQR